MREFREIDCEGLDGLGSQLVLCVDDMRRGCENTFDLASGFFKNVNKLSSKYQNNPFELEDPKYLHYESDAEGGLEDDLEDELDDGIT